MPEVIIDPKVFNAVYRPHLGNMARVQVFFGGSSSGKSVFLAQRDIIDVMKGGRNFLICRQVGRTLRGSVVQEAQKVIAQWGLAHLFSINKTDGTITCNNGYQIIFAGLDDVEKLKSLTPAKGVITDIRIEEATETDRQTVKQLLKRQRGGDPATPKRLTLSFNPVMQTSWIYQDYFARIAWADDQTSHDDGNLSILKTWYIHNRFLTPDDIADLENETDPYFRDVYTFGKWGVLGDVIFKNWEVRDLSDLIPTFDNLRFGLDFGFSSDPAALVCSHYDKARKTIYIFNEFYERGLTNDMLADGIRPFVNYRRIIGDSSEPKSIQELRNSGIDAIGARKGPDSIMHGIQWLQQHAVVIDSRCINTRNEFQQYQWQRDKDGNAIRRPVDKNNHIIDALRYAYEDDSAGSLEAGATSYV
jgi:phage terminase large subunit